MAGKTKGATSLERALNRAMAENIQPVKTGASTYTVLSSRGDATYTVTVRGCEYTCTCPSQGRHCKHSAAVMMSRMAERLETAATVDSRESAPLAQPVNSRSGLYGAAA